MSELRFGSEQEALQHLANITGKKVKVAYDDNGFSSPEQEEMFYDQHLNMTDKRHYLDTRYDDKEDIEYEDEEDTKISTELMKEFSHLLKNTKDLPQESKKTARPIECELKNGYKVKINSFFYGPMPYDRGTFLEKIINDKGEEIEIPKNLDKYTKKDKSNKYFNLMGTYYRSMKDILETINSI